MNTQLVYLYRDGSNYKEWGDVVVAGRPSCGIREMRRRLEKTLEDGSYFIAGQVGLPEVFLWDSGGYSLCEDDHCWHEYDHLKLTESAPSDPGITADGLLELFERAAAEGWKEFEPDAC